MRPWQIAVEHSKLAETAAVAAAKTRWRDALASLAKRLAS
jgi:hypothetical protein